MSLYYDIEGYHTIVIRYRTIFNISKLVIAKNIMKQANKETLRYVARLGVSLILPTIYVIIIPYIYHNFLHTGLISMNCIFIILGNLWNRGWRLSRLLGRLLGLFCGILLGLLDLAITLELVRRSNQLKNKLKYLHKHNQSILETPKKQSTSSTPKTPQYNSPKTI